MSGHVPWWVEYEGRLEHEIAALEALGISSELDEERRARDGVIRLDIEVPDELSGQGVVPLEVTFPDTYPFHRPDVVAPTLRLHHHQHPFGRNLCLIGRDSRWWHSGDTLAALLAEQLRPALMAGAGRTEGLDVPEEDQGEPFSDYYAFDHNMTVLVDSEWAPRPGDSGNATFRTAGACAPDRYFVAIAERLQGASGGSWSIPEEVLQLYPGATEVHGTWVMLDAPPTGADGAELWQMVDGLGGAVGGRAPVGGPELRLVGFPEERTSATTGPGWFLLARVAEGRPAEVRKRARSGSPVTRAAAPSARVFVVRAGRAGADDFRARSPYAAQLSSRRVVMIGAGAIGSVFAVELARLGLGEITIVDRDVLEPGNLVRHACTIRHVGLPKSGAVAQVIRESQPYVRANIMHYPLGTAASPEVREQLAEYIERADLVVDATAEVGTQEYTAHLARRAKRPWLMIEGTAGAWGGSVVCIPPSSEWCFSCLQWHRAEGRIPWPPAEEGPALQPPGCAEPTFVGAGFDLAEVSLQGARAAAAVLSSRPTRDVALLALRDADGAEMLPTWTAFGVTRHDKCHHS